MDSNICDKLLIDDHSILPTIHKKILNLLKK